MQAWLHAALILLLALPFAADLIFPLGTAVWVAYLLPVVLSYAAARSQLPLFVAAGATVLMIVGMPLAPAGVDPQVAITNRTLACLTCWTLAIVGLFFIRNRVAIAREEWMQGGQVGLAKAVGGEQPLDTLATSALTFLADYLKAKAGALYIANGEGFRRYATYAVPAHAPLPERFDVGDGLLGQAVADRRSFLLNDVPDGYLCYGSALGQAKPESLLIATAQADGVINAVVELGLPKGADAQALALLERIAGQLGVASDPANIAPACANCLKKRSSKPRSCRRKARNCALITRSWSSRAAISRNRRPVWRPSNPNWSRPIPSWRNRQGSWKSSAMT